LQVIFEGQAHVQVGKKGPIVKDEKYCCMSINVMKDNRDIIHCQPGKHKYHFSLNMPHKIPGSIVVEYGYIAYWITAVVDFVGDDILIRNRKTITVGSYVDLNAYSVCKKSIHRYAEKNIMCGICTIVFEVKLLQGGYVPSQTIKFICKVENMSSINVKKVKFKIVQIFKMYTQDYQQQHVKVLGKEEDVEDSFVPSDSEKTWTVPLSIPSDAVAPDLTGCTIIKMQCEIIGTLVLPFPYRNLKLRVPFYLGTVPITSTAI
ncbi:hypothetical protein ILUMI_07133, partial [Ignelater luminosus]